MIRNVLSVIVGYVAMAVVIFIAFTIAYMVLGADGAFESNAYQVSTAWLAMAVIVNLIAAVIGGLVCKAIARKTITTIVFAMIVFVLGVIVAIPTLTSDAEPKVREGDVAMFDAMNDAEQPDWFCLANPVIAAVGILAGGALIPAGSTSTNRNE